MWVETMTGKKKKDYVKIGFYGCDQKNQSFFFLFFSDTTNVRSFNFFVLFLGFDEIDKK